MDDVLKSLRGFHYSGYNYGKKDKFGTRYGCIKKNYKAKLIINESHDLNSVRLLIPHTCSKSEHESMEKKIMRKLCQKKSVHSIATTSKAVFDQVSFENPHIAGLVAFPAMQKTIQRARKSNNNGGVNAEYSSLEAFDKHLAKYPDLLSFTENDLKISFQVLSAKSDQLIFYDIKLIKKLEPMNDLFIDATFDVVPKIKGVMQLLTIMSKKNNIVVPGIWILMTRKTTEAYSAVWMELKTLAAFYPQKIVCDFERALMKSLKEAFPDVRIQGCYFHFTQAILRKAKSKEYRLYSRSNKSTNGIAKEILKNIFLLALLPEEKVEEGVLVIKNLIKSKIQNNDSLLKKWRKFVNLYLFDFWMKKVTPQIFSVFGMVDRTNNFVESYHKTLNHQLRKRPSTYTFIYSILKIKEQALLDLERARNYMQPKSAQKPKVLMRDLAIRNAWKELQATKPWSVETFLRELSGYKEDDAFDGISDNSTTTDFDESSDSYDNNYIHLGTFASKISREEMCMEIENAEMQRIKPLKLKKVISETNGKEEWQIL